MRGNSKLLSAEERALLSSEQLRRVIGVIGVIGGQMSFLTTTRCRRHGSRHEGKPYDPYDPYALRGEAYGFSLMTVARQSRWMSLAESVANVILGFVLALVTQVLLFPWFGWTASAADNLLIATIFTVVSLLRSFTLRRLFERIGMRKQVS